MQTAKNLQERLIGIEGLQQRLGNQAGPPPETFYCRSI